MTAWRVLALAALLLAFDANLARGPWLRLEIRVHHRLVWTAQALDRERFDIAFTHSSERCRWIHHFAVDSRGVRLLGSTFPCFGAGMPTESTDGTPTTQSSEGFDVAAPLVLGTLRMINWRPAAITLRHRSRDIALGERLPDFATFEITVH